MFNFVCFTNPRFVLINALLRDFCLLRIFTIKLQRKQNLKKGKKIEKQNKIPKKRLEENSVCKVKFLAMCMCFFEYLFIFI